MELQTVGSVNRFFFYCPISWRILRRIFFIKWPKRFNRGKWPIFRSNGRYYWIFLMWTSKKKVLKSRWKWYQSPGRHQEWTKSGLRSKSWFFEKLSQPGGGGPLSTVPLSSLDMIHTWYIRDTYVTHTWHIRDTYVIHTWYIRGYFQGIFRVFSGYFLGIFRVFSGYFQDIFRVLVLGFASSHLWCL